MRQAAAAAPRSAAATSALDDARRLLAGLEARNLRTLEDPSVGIYSPHGRAGGGGLKVHNEAFREIVYTAIDSLSAPVGAEAAIQTAEL